MDIEVIESKRTDKLTVAKDRITIKFTEWTPEEVRTREYKLAEIVARTIQHKDMITRRGYFVYLPKQDKFCITMCIQTNSKGNKVDPMIFLETNTLDDINLPPDKDFPYKAKANGQKYTDNEKAAFAARMKLLKEIKIGDNK